MSLILFVNGTLNAKHMFYNHYYTAQNFFGILKSELKQQYNTREHWNRETWQRPYRKCKHRETGQRGTRPNSGVRARLNKGGPELSTSCRPWRIICAEKKSENHSAILSALIRSPCSRRTTTAAAASTSDDCEVCLVAPRAGFALVRADMRGSVNIVQ